MNSILRYFRFDHLPMRVRPVSAPFSALAHNLARSLPDGPEKSVALRRLLESKDAAVRAGLDLPETDQ